jgi:hypothetical protein
MKTQEQLFDALDNSREKLLIAIELLPDEALFEKRAVGEWSIDDVLVNITAWEAELVTGLMRIRQNKRPDKLLAALKDPSEFDRRQYAEIQGRDLDQIFLDLQQVRVQVEEWILEFSERELNNPRRYPWLKGKALHEIIASATFEREKKFIPLVQLFSQQWSILAMEAADEIISLEPRNLNVQENNHDDAD